MLILVYIDLLKWKATLIGPIDTPYEGGIFELSIQFPVNYPFKPPTIKFMTKIYHCNISLSSGELTILRERGEGGERRQSEKRDVCVRASFSMQIIRKACICMHAYMTFLHSEIN